MTLFEKLLIRLETICGDSNDETFYTFDSVDTFTASILKDGHVLWNNKYCNNTSSSNVNVLNLHMKPNKCHEDSCLASYLFPNYDIMTGYTCRDGSWYIHTWLFNSKKGEILEPHIEPEPEVYYGILLEGRQKEQFMFRWNPSWKID